MKRRNTNFELLRIISMLMILVLHYFMHGGILNDISNLSFCNELLVIILETVSIVAVNIYILISSYYQSEKEFNLKRLISTFVTVWVFNILISGSMMLFGVVECNTTNLFYTFFPIISQEYWFINAYIFLMILSPFINKLVKMLSKKEFTSLLLVLIVINSIISLITKNSVAMSSANSLSWFINLYLIGSYLKKYSLEIDKKNNIFIYILSNVCLIAFTMLILLVKDINMAMNLYKYNNILVLLSSVSLFIIFSNKRESNNNRIKKAILFIAKYCFIVYIITENNLFRNYLWQNIVKTSAMSDTYYFIPLVLLKVMALFISCIIFGYFVQKIIDKIITVVEKKREKVIAK